MLNEKKICNKLEEILGTIKELRMGYFKIFPEDVNEDRVSWSSLYDMATDDYYSICNVKRELQTLVDDIDECKYDE